MNNRYAGRVLIFAPLVYFFLLGPIIALAGEDPYFKAAVKNYSKGRHEAAIYYFKKSNRSNPKEEERKAAEYAISAISANSAYLDDLEKTERSAMLDGMDAAGKIALAEKHYRLAVILMHDKFYLFMVEPHLKRAVYLDPDGPAAYLALAGAYYSAMRYDKAVKFYEKIINLMPGNLYAYKMAGDACVAMGDFDRAKEFYTDLVDANEKALLKYEPSEMEKIKGVMRVLPRTYKDVDELLKEERLDEAEVVLKKRLSLNGADCIALTELGIIYQSRGDRRMAVKLFKKAIQAAPDYPMSHFFLGRLHFIMRDYAAAVTELNIFKDKIKLLPRMDKETKKMYINCLYYLGEVYFTLKEYAKFKSETDEILKLDPKEQAAYYDLGIYYYKYERSRSKSYQCLKKVIELDPKTDIAKEAEYAIEFMRNNPDPRVAPDFSFINQEYRQ